MNQKKLTKNIKSNATQLHCDSTFNLKQKKKFEKIIENEMFVYLFPLFPMFPFSFSICVHLMMIVYLFRK